MINERLIDTKVDENNVGEERLYLHLDANDVDSYDGDGAEWVDITNHEYTTSINVSEHFNTVLHTGTSSGNTVQITGVGFQPDLVITKARNAVQVNATYDSVRGVGNGVNAAGERMLSTSLINRQSDYDGRVNGYISSFDSDGFTATKGTGSGFYYYNRISYNYVSWCFKGGGAAVSNTDGTITSQVSANNDLNFSIVKYTGTNLASDVGHGLGIAPELVMVKALDSSTSNWTVQSNLLSGKRGILNSNTSFVSSTTDFRDDATSTVLQLSSNSSSNVNRNGESHIAYCFASKRGISKVGNYTGTSAAGNKIYTGFEPAFIMIKRTDGSEDWWIVDNKTSTTSGQFNKYLEANTTTATVTPGASINIHNDGFSFNGVSFNNNNQSFIYYAVAKNNNETSLMPSKDEFTAGSVLNTDLELNLDANSYSGSGNWLDGTSNGHDGTITGATYANNDSSDYFSFDGSNDKVDFTGRPVPATSDVTIEVWVKFEAGGGNYPYVAMIGQGTGTAGSVLSISRFLNTDNFYSYLGNQFIDTGISLSNSKWYHLAVTQSGTSLSQYIDGELVNTASVTSNNFADNFRLGYFYDTSAVQEVNFFKGEIGQARVYSSALTPTQIKSNYDATRIYNAVDLDLHLDAASFPQYGESGYSNTPSTWTALTGSNGTISGATFDSELGNWLDFDGNNDEVRLNSGNNISASTFNNCTFEYWIRLDNLSETRHLYFHDFTTNNVNYIGLSKSNINNKLMVFGSSSHINIARGNTDLVANKWTHIAVTLTSSELKMYIDGELDATVSQSFNGFSSPLYGSIGNDRRGQSTAGPKWLNGQVGQVRVYNSAITQDQVRQNYNFTKPSYPNGYNGTISGATWNSGGYFDFDGINDYVDMGSASSIIPAGNDFSIEIWVNAKSNTENRYWGAISATNTTSPYGGWMIYNHYNDDTWGIAMNKSGAWTSLSSGVSIVKDKWEHLVYTYDGSFMKLYVNGELSFSSSQSGSLQYNLGSQVLYIGRSIDRYAPVKVGQVRIYESTAITQNQVLQNYNSTKSNYPN